MKFIRINPIKNIQALECAKKIRAQRSYCATCVAVILLLQAVVALAVEPVPAKASIESPEPAAESAQTVENGIPLTGCCAARITPSTPIAGRRRLRQHGELRAARCPGARRQNLSVVARRH